ncbi:MAG: hypothetical protein JNJ69_04330, partial [Leptospiraceae bacterium]|nr:hypothetical protein [Leptospiraceae bacterium]
ALLKCWINPKRQFYSKDSARGKLGIYSIPILNPAGVARETRANARGVDLNRNSGVRAENALPFFGGHGISAALPYFQGKALQRESRALFRFLREFALRRRKQVQLALDIHSGYGTQNFLWWPYSYSKRTVFQNSAFQAVADRLRQRHPLYRIEPMSLSYQTHGDLWDKALLDFEHRVKEGQYKKSLFLPFTLEIGTWHEIKKNPRRLLSREKIFDPPAESRKAYLREHRAMLWDFLHSYVDRSHRRLLRGRIPESD